MHAWMRKLEIILTSNKLHKRLIFGNISHPEDEQLSISIICNKYMSIFKDSCLIKIDNLTYSQMLNIIDGEYYNVEVKCGYKDGNVFTIFDGGVLYVSNSLGDKKTNTINIACGNIVVAKYNQKILNYTVSEGTNAYTAFRRASQHAGVSGISVKLSDKLKDITLSEPINIAGSLTSWIDNFVKTLNQNATDSTDLFVVNSDSSNGALYSIINLGEKYASPIEIQPEIINLIGGYPRLTTEGVNVTLLPVYRFCCGDSILLDNSLLDLSALSASDAYKNYIRYLNDNGKGFGTYTIFEVEYRLQNRSSQFSVNVKCKNYNLIKRAREALNGR